jgi:hypothetical protein
MAKWHTVYAFLLLTGAMNAGACLLAKPFLETHLRMMSSKVKIRLKRTVVNTAVKKT